MRVGHVLWLVCAGISLTAGLWLVGCSREAPSTAILGSWRVVEGGNAGATVIFAKGDPMKGGGTYSWSYGLEGEYQWVSSNRMRLKWSMPATYGNYTMIAEGPGIMEFEDWQDF